MPPTLRRSRTPAAVLALALAVQAAPALAQDTDPAAPWPPVEAGVRFGYDDGSNATVAGAHLRIPVLRNGWVELVPAGEAIFLTGLTEYQFIGDVAIVPGGPQGGLYVAGGFIARNSIYDGPERETRTGGSVALGLNNRGRGDVPLAFQIELRWVFIDAPFDPRAVTVGVNLPLWGWSQRSAR